MTTAQALDRPIVVLGAARSGTKMLRDAIGSHPSLTAIPHDINYVWKYGNYGIDHDELLPSQLTPRIARYIRAYLSRHIRSSGAERLVEKTVSNCLRVDFVREVLPDCRFVHLVRDGRDVAASARRMWRAPAEWRRLFDKLRRFPLRAIPTYGTQYLRSYLAGTVRGTGGAKSWGPRFRDIDEVARQHPLLEVCGLQWSACVESTMSSLETLPSTTSCTVRYEELVRSPQTVLEGVLTFLDLEMTETVRDHIEKTISPRHIGKWSAELSEPEAVSLSRLIAPTLERAGYAAAQDRP